MHAMCIFWCQTNSGNLTKPTKIGFCDCSWLTVYLWDNWGFTSVTCYNFDSPMSRTSNQHLSHHVPVIFCLIVTTIEQKKYVTTGWSIKSSVEDLRIEKCMCVQLYLLKDGRVSIFISTMNLLSSATCPSLPYSRAASARNLNKIQMSITYTWMIKMQTVKDY